MIRIKERLAGERIWFHCVESKKDLAEVRDFIRGHRALGMDTESTGLNCYRPGWRLRTVQFGSKWQSYVVPQQYRRFIGWAFEQDVNWIGHNGPHDIRCVDEHLGYETGVVCAGETYIPAHHKDSRNKQEGGIGHGLKDLAEKWVDRDAGRWEVELKKVFKTIEIPIPGEVYKSGPRKGLPKVRKARIDEGWSLIDPMHPAYVAYAAADPVLTVWVWEHEQPILEQFYELYHFDKRVQHAMDRLQRRAIRLDVPYTKRLSNEYMSHAERMMLRANDYGCANIQSGQQIAATLEDLGAELTATTDSGQYKTDAKVLRGLMKDPYSNGKIVDFVRAVLVAKQLTKRRESYTDAMLRERDQFDRVHPSINALAARTTRSSVSGPPLQQLPTKDHEDEILWESESDL